MSYYSPEVSEFVEQVLAPLEEEPDLLGRYSDMDPRLTTAGRVHFLFHLHPDDDCCSLLQLRRSLTRPDACVMTAENKLRRLLRDAARFADRENRGRFLRARGIYLHLLDMWKSTRKTLEWDLHASMKAEMYVKKEEVKDELPCVGDDDDSDSNEGHIKIGLITNTTNTQIDSCLSFLQLPTVAPQPDWSPPPLSGMLRCSHCALGFLPDEEVFQCEGSHYFCYDCREKDFVTCGNKVSAAAEAIDPRDVVERGRNFVVKCPDCTEEVYSFFAEEHKCERMEEEPTVTTAFKCPVSECVDVPLDLDHVNRSHAVPGDYVLQEKKGGERCLHGSLVLPSPGGAVSRVVGAKVGKEEAFLVLHLSPERDSCLAAVLIADSDAAAVTFKLKLSAKHAHAMEAELRSVDCLEAANPLEGTGMVMALGSNETNKIFFKLVMKEEG